MEHTFSGIFEEIDGYFMAWIEELPGANAQGKTIEEARTNLIEAAQLILETNRDLAEQGLIGRSVIREKVLVTL
ncbi:MAG: type II toxin-antitoxin system HicB family antitoxin [Candidatus Sericytochromatia bacterium]|jgi:predicted RNase H-like HicB family nuclease